MSDITPQDTFYPIKGIPLPKISDPRHPIPVRQEINAWYHNPANALQVSLFVQALDEFQQTKWEKKLSYYQVAGIHGFPKQVWDQSGTEGFYCAHNTPTFPTWHRAYLTLYEQRIYECMTKVIKASVPQVQQAVWTAAANHWRLPYWDYAATPALPDICLETAISVLNPKTERWDLKLDPNPFYTYRFDRINKDTTMGDEKKLGDLNFAIEDNHVIDDDTKEEIQVLPWSKCKGTSRHSVKTGPADGWRDGVSDNQKVQDALATPNWNGKAKGTIKENVYRLFTEKYLKSWATFSSTKYYQAHQDKTEWLSVEAIHNMIHLWTGGSDVGKKGWEGDLVNGTGHMMDVPVAAFDPVFWLHHCFIDRLATIWQEIHQGDQYWFDHPVDKPDPDPTPLTILRPFHKEAAGPNADYNSNDVRDWTKLSYQYEIVEVKDDERDADGTVNQEKHTARIMQDLNSLYSTTRSEVLEGIDENVKGVKNDYIINILYNRYGLNGGEPYMVHIFVGPIDDIEDPTWSGSYRTHPNRVGSVFTFSSPYETSEGRVNCSNCKKQAESGALSCAQIPITGALIKDAVNDEVQGLLGTVEKSAVEKYLEKELKWKVFRITGEEIPLSRLPDLKLAVLAGKGEHTGDDDTVLSKYGNYKPIFGATEGKNGGAEDVPAIRELYGF